MITLTGYAPSPNWWRGSPTEIAVEQHHRRMNPKRKRK